MITILTQDFKIHQKVMRRITSFKTFVLIGAILFSFNLSAQTHLGVTTSNYDALHAGRFNPASFATSNMKWQVNLVGVDVSVVQDYLKLDRNSGNNDDYTDHFTENLNGDDKSGSISILASLPGFMFTHEKAGTFALNFAAKGFITFRDVNEDFISSMYNEANTPSEWSTPWADTDLSAGLNSFGEVALSYARKALEKDRHVLYAGATFKLLTRAVGGNANGAAAFIYDDNGTPNFEDDDEISFGMSDLNLQVSDVFDNISDESSDNSDFGPAGFAADLGVVYEFKPEKAGQALVGDNKAKSNTWRKARSDYIVKAGFSINNIGAVKFTPSQEYSRDFTSDGTFVDADLVTQDDLTFEDWDDVMDAAGSFTIPSDMIKVRTPLSINLFADAKITDFFYVNLSSSIFLGKSDIEKGTVREGTSIALTPRLETPAVALYVPISFSPEKGVGLGAVARFGQVTLGMSDITGLFTGDASNTSVHFGLSFGIVNKKNKKSADDDEETEDDRYL